jgi:hypothetical protein
MTAGEEEEEEEGWETVCFEGRHRIPASGPAGDMGVISPAG